MLMKWDIGFQERKLSIVTAHFLRAMWTACMAPGFSLQTRQKIHCLNRITELTEIWNWIIKNRLFLNQCDLSRNRKSAAIIARATAAVKRMTLWSRQSSLNFVSTKKSGYILIITSCIKMVIFCFSITKRCGSMVPTELLQGFPIAIYLWHPAQCQHSSVSTIFFFWSSESSFPHRQQIQWKIFQPFSCNV